MRGVSLIDVVVGTALMLIIFLGMFSAFQSSIALNALSKARASATAIANSQMERIRGMNYDDIGTVGGIPAGLLDETATTTLNGVLYTTRTFVQYVDDPADGTGSDDENGITTDYKKVKVAVTYNVSGKDSEVSLVSNVSPLGLETTEGGGTLKVVVIDASANPVVSAQVHIVNPSTNPTIDTTAFSNNNGVVFLPGAPTSTDYRIYVSKSGYSSAQTYDQDAGNINPNPGHLSVEESVTTQATFAIDVLSNLLVRTFSPVASGSFEDTFADDTSVSTSSSVSIASGEATLSGGAGAYVSSGFLRSATVTPAHLSSWGSASASTSTPEGTSVSFQVFYDDNGTQTLVPDSDLPGNSTGLQSGADISGLSTQTYPSLILGANLASSDVALTPEIFDWDLSYSAGPTPLPNVAFTMTGSKTIGEDGSGDPIYKTVVNGNTVSTAQHQMTGIEWDAYTFDIPDFDTVEACASNPFPLAPASDETLDFTLTDKTTNNLRVIVKDESENLLSGADVSVSASGVSESSQTSSCGQVYFGGLPNQSDYTISVSAAGHTFEDVTAFEVNGATTITISAE